MNAPAKRALSLRRDTERRARMAGVPFARVIPTPMEEGGRKLPVLGGFPLNGFLVVSGGRTLQHRQQDLSLVTRSRQKGRWYGVVNDGGILSNGAVRVGSMVTLRTDDFMELMRYVARMEREVARHAPASDHDRR